MAEQIPNGNSASYMDVEMKEEIPPETTLNGIQQAPSTETLPSYQAAIPPSMDGGLQAPPAPGYLSSLQPVQQAIHSAVTPPAPLPRPSSIPPPPSARPEKPAAHGGPTRQYLNQNLTSHLLEGMKYLAVYEPEKPLLWLSEFLRDRSKEVEG